MARYIDADKLIEALRADYDREGEKADDMAIKGLSDASVKYSHGQFCYLNAIERVKDIPTADVVPKSEVVKALNEVELLIIITKEMYKQQMEDAPNELSKQSKRTKWVAFEKFYEQFAEFKKKYTGEKE